MTRKSTKVRGLFERPKGSGVWWIRWKDATGQDHREMIGPKRLAEDAYRLRRTQVREGRLFPERLPDITVAAMVDDMLKRKRDRRSIKDIERYAKFWKAALGARMLRQVKRGEIERQLAVLGEKRSKQTMYHYGSFLRSLFRAALEDGRVDRSPMPRLRGPHGARSRYLSDEEERALLEHLPDDAARDLVLFAVNTGLRQADQFALRWASVDMKQRVLTIARTKSGRAHVVHLNDTSIAVLKRQPHRLRCPWVWPMDGKSGHRNAHNFYQRVFRPAAEAAGLEWLTWHHLRHTFASRLVIAGVDVRAVQELLGHSSLAMVQRYSHLAPGHLAEAVKRLNGRGKSGTTGGTGEGHGS